MTHRMTTLLARPPKSPAKSPLKRPTRRSGMRTSTAIGLVALLVVIIGAAAYQLMLAAG